MTNHEIWLSKLEGEKTKPYFQNILSLVKEDKKQYVVAPDREDWFRALEFPNIDDIKVIITDSKPTVPSYLQDGLAWSSLAQASRPMKLLYKKLYEEVGIIYDQGDNTKDRWEAQGIMLLNMELTSTENKHKTYSWSHFTMKIVQYFLSLKQPRAFLLLDDYSKQYTLSNKNNHLLVQTKVTSQSFSQTPIFTPINSFIERHYSTRINWE